MTREEGYARARAILEDLVRPMSLLGSGGKLGHITVGTEGYGSRNLPGTKVLMGVELPNVEHFVVVSAQGEVTTASEKFQLKVTMEVPSPGWNDDLIRRFFAEGVEALSHE